MRSHRARAFSGAVVVAAMCVVGVAAPAVAVDTLPESERDAALWYANDWFNYDELREAGATGAGVKIAVIDDAINTGVPELAGANITVQGSTCINAQTGKPWEVDTDDAGIAAHGTNAVAMIVGNGVAGDGGAGTRGIAPEAEILFYGVGDFDVLAEDGCELHDPTAPAGDTSLMDEYTALYNPRGLMYGSSQQGNPWKGGSATALAARAAIRDGADVITTSTGEGTNEWAPVLFEARKAGIPVLNAATNPDQLLMLTVGAERSNGTVAVGAVDKAGEEIRDPETGLPGRGGYNLAVVAPGEDLLGVGTADGWGPALVHGTSYATPMVAGAIALGLQKYPEASGHQVLQSMVRTTGDGSVHEPAWIDDKYGYGYLNPAGMVASDPTEFPDVNPVHIADVTDPRCVYDDGSGGATWLNADGSEHLTEEEARALLESGETPRWGCQWTLSPTNLDEEFYWEAWGDDAVAAGEDVVNDGGVVGNGGPSLWLLVLLIGGGVVLLAGVVVAVVVPVVRSKRRRAQQQSQQVVPQPQYSGQAPQPVQQQVYVPGAYPPQVPQQSVPPQQQPSYPQQQAQPPQSFEGDRS